VARIVALALENLTARLRLETLGFVGLMTANNNPLDSQKNPSEFIGFVETLGSKIKNFSNLQSENCRRCVELVRTQL
jgi:hypothetical protein